MITWVVALLLCLAMAAPVYAGDTFGVSGTEEWRFATGNAPSFIASGCLPVPVSGLTLGAFPCTAFVRLADGHQEAIIQPSSAFSLGAFGDGTYWLLLYRDTGTTVGGGWLRSAIGTTKATRYLAQKAVTRPAEVPGGIIFASLVVSGGNITTVNDLRTSLTMAMTGIDSPLDQMYGAKGDGVTDDYIPVQVAISSGRSLNFSNKTYKIGTKLLFLKSEATYRGEGATLLNVPTTTATGTRLADITGSDLLFDGVNFDGNALPVKGFLVYLGPNAARVKFHNLTIGNILSHEWGTNPKNFVVGLGISPYGVVDFEVVGVQFANIIKYNDGSTLIPASAAIVGIGNAHGIFFMNEDFSEPNAAQVTYTAGVIDNSVFDNIQTVLATGLSENDRIEFDDGDGIRFYGCAPGSCVGSPTRLAVKMTNLTFRKVSKRAIKMSAARGQIVDNITVYGAELPYGMVSIIKLDNDSFVSNVTGWAESGKPYIVALQMQGNYNTHVRGVYIEFAITGVEVASGVPNSRVGDMSFARIHCNSCSRLGFHMNNLATVATTQINIRLLDSSFNGSGAINANGLLVQPADDNTGGLVVDNVTFYNMDLKFLGLNNALLNSYMLIGNGSYAGSSPGRALIEAGDGILVRNVTVDAPGIADAYLNATRDFLLFFGGDGIRVEGLTLKVKETLSVDYPHLVLRGSDNALSGVVYTGPGSFHIGTSAGGGAAIRTSVTNLTRLGSTATAKEFIYTDHANNANIAIDGVYDLRATSASTIRLNGGQVTHTISNVSSATTNAKIVAHGNLAKTTNIQLFSANTFATLTAQEDGVVMWCRDCTKATPCAGSGTGAYAKRMNGAWDCD